MWHWGEGTSEVKEGRQECRHVWGTERPSIHRTKCKCKKCKGGKGEEMCILMKEGFENLKNGVGGTREREREQTKRSGNIK